MSVPDIGDPFTKPKKARSLASRRSRDAEPFTGAPERLVEGRKAVCQRRLNFDPFATAES